MPIGLLRAGTLSALRQHVPRYKKIAADILTLLGQRVVQRAAGLVSIYFLARHLAPTLLGQYQFAGVAIAAIAFTALTGLDNAIMQAVSRGSRGLYRRGLKVGFAASTVGGLLLGSAALLCRELRPDAVVPLAVGAACFPLYAGLIQWKSVLLGEGRFSVWSLVESSNALATHGLIVAAVLLDVQDVGVFITLYLLPTSLINVAMTYITWRRCGEGKSDEGDDLFRYGVRTSAINVVGSLSEQVERILIFLVVGPAALAVFLAGDRLSELVRSVAQDAAAVLAPRFARMSSYSVKLARVIQLICLTAGVLIVVFAFTFAPAILIGVFGPQYSPSIPYAQALLCSVAIGNVGQFQFRFIRSQANDVAFRDVVLWTSGVRILACLALVPAFGLWGAVAGIFAHRLGVSATTSFVLSRRSLSDQPPQPGTSSEQPRAASHPAGSEEHTS
ncbi:oligosaccharide flippase family protein [Phenylobacterium sp.]|jgi:O-antigen/teichoic acid export membrane protein|uniref:oligosaccharide flippase family protein n=1 Tax=Phenylobacterium sp. TaxID=1871053 RepID=UPI002F929A42